MNSARLLRRLLTAVVAAIVAIAVMASGIMPVSAGGKDKDAELPMIAVKLEPGYSIGAINDSYGTTVAEVLLGSRGLYLLDVTAIDATKIDKKQIAKVAKAMAKERGVVYAEVASAEDEPEDDSFHAWPEGLLSDVGPDPTKWSQQEALGYLRLDDVHRISTGEGIKVAVIDTGVDVDHPYLVDHLGSAGYDFVDDDRVPDDVGNGIDDDGDGVIDESVGHGTHTAGMIRLVAPDAEILVYRVLDSDGRGNPYLVAEAVDQALADGADVINVSFGMRRRTRSRVLKNAIKAAARADVPIVAAAGNDGDKRSHYPAGEKEVISVGAAGSDDELAEFSNHGKGALVAAPGVDVVSTVPGGGFGAWSGTSMATPIVAGQVALVRSHDPDRELKKVIEVLGKTSNKMIGKNKVEKGIIDILDSLEEL